MGNPILTRECAIGGCYCPLILFFEGGGFPFHATDLIEAVANWNAPFRA